MAELQFIGTGDAFGSGGRRNSAILLRESGTSVLLDCGPTTHTGLQALGIDPVEIDAIAISHFHGDHVAGVPFLLLDYLYVHRRRRPLTILGPPGIQARIDGLTGLYEYRGEIERRYELRYRELSSPNPLEIGANLTLTPLPAHHHSSTRPHMLRVETPNRQILYSGDTGWHAELPRRVGEADLFVCECVFMEAGFEYHLDHETLESQRERFRCRRILLTHLGREVIDDLGRVRFDTAHDGMKLSL